MGNVRLLLDKQDYKEALKYYLRKRDKDKAKTIFFRFVELDNDLKDIVQKQAETLRCYDHRKMFRKEHIETARFVDRLLIIIFEEEIKDELKNLFYYHELIASFFKDHNEKEKQEDNKCHPMLYFEDLSNYIPRFQARMSFNLKNENDIDVFKMIDVYGYKSDNTLYSDRIKNPINLLTLASLCYYTRGINELLIDYKPVDINIEFIRDFFDAYMNIFNLFCTVKGIKDGKIHLRVNGFLSWPFIFYTPSIAFDMTTNKLLLMNKTKRPLTGLKSHLPILYNRLIDLYFMDMLRQRNLSIIDNILIELQLPFIDLHKRATEYLMETYTNQKSKKLKAFSEKEKHLVFSLQAIVLAYMIENEIQNKEINIWQSVGNGLNNNEQENYLIFPTSYYEGVVELAFRSLTFALSQLEAYENEDEKKYNIDNLMSLTTLPLKSIAKGDLNFIVERDIKKFFRVYIKLHKGKIDFERLCYICNHVVNLLDMALSYLDRLLSETAVKQNNEKSESIGKENTFWFLAKRIHNFKSSYQTEGQKKMFESLMNKIKHYIKLVPYSKQEVEEALEYHGLNEWKAYIMD